MKFTIMSEFPREWEGNKTVTRGNWLPVKNGLGYLRVTQAKSSCQIFTLPEIGESVKIPYPSLRTEEKGVVVGYTAYHRANFDRPAMAVRVGKEIVIVYRDDEVDSSPWKQGGGLDFSYAGEDGWERLEPFVQDSLLCVEHSEELERMGVEIVRAQTWGVCGTVYTTDGRWGLPIAVGDLYDKKFAGYHRKQDLRGYCTIHGAITKALGIE